MHKEMCRGLCRFVPAFAQRRAWARPRGAAGAGESVRVCDLVVCQASAGVGGVPALWWCVATVVATGRRSVARRPGSRQPVKRQGSGFVLLALEGAVLSMCPRGAEER